VIVRVRTLSVPLAHRHKGTITNIRKINNDSMHPVQIHTRKQDKDGDHLNYWPPQLLASDTVATALADFRLSFPAFPAARFCRDFVPTG